MAPIAGHSPFGQELKKVHSQGENSERLTVEPKIGRIKSVIPNKTGESQFIVVLEFIDKTTGKTVDSKPMPLIDHPKQINGEHGMPKDLPLLNLYCEVTFTGPSSGRGRARIIRSMTDDGAEATKWGELPQDGASWAMPGSGFG